jgi:hypothetical protein
MPGPELFFRIFPTPWNPANFLNFLNPRTERCADSATSECVNGSACAFFYPKRRVLHSFAKRVNPQLVSFFLLLLLGSVLIPPRKLLSLGCIPGSDKFLDSSAFVGVRISFCFIRGSYRRRWFFWPPDLHTRTGALTDVVETSYAGTQRLAGMACGEYSPWSFILFFLGGLTCVADRFALRRTTEDDR